MARLGSFPRPSEMYNHASDMDLGADGGGGFEGTAERVDWMLDWIQRKSWPNGHERTSRSLALVDLFCGCGGLTLGVWEAARRCRVGIDIRLAVDYAQPPLTVYRHNFSSSADVAVRGRIQDMFDGQLGAPITNTERGWKRRVGHVDLIVAGPPCQGHSDLNNSTRRNDPRNELYLRAVRAAEVLKPTVILIENVPTVVLDRGKAIQAARLVLRDSGYEVTDGKIPIFRFGVPQHRRRHLLVATQGTTFDLDGLLDSLRGRKVTVGQFISGLEDEPDEYTEPFYRPSTMSAQNRKRVGYLFSRNAYNLPDRLRPPCHQDGAHSYVSMYGRMYWDRPSQTITSGFGSMGQGRFVHPRRRRTITPHEAARLQGFPDFFDFSAVKYVTALREMIGNAVPPQVTATLVSRLIAEGFL